MTEKILQQKPFFRTPGSSIRLDETNTMVSTCIIAGPTYKNEKVILGKRFWKSYSR